MQSEDGIVAVSAVNAQISDLASMAVRRACFFSSRDEDERRDAFTARIREMFMLILLFPADGAMS